MVCLRSPADLKIAWPAYLVASAVAVATTTPVASLATSTFSQTTVAGSQLPDYFGWLGTARLHLPGHHPPRRTVSGFPCSAAVATTMPAIFGAVVVVEAPRLLLGSRMHLLVSPQVPLGTPVSWLPVQLCRYFGRFNHIISATAAPYWSCVASPAIFLTGDHFRPLRHLPAQL